MKSGDVIMHGRERRHDHFGNRRLRTVESDPEPGPAGLDRMERVGQEGWTRRTGGDSRRRT